jgi:glyoxylase-like metal-dependent hydrolase (beta-lactamase superfamily II)
MRRDRVLRILAPNPSVYTLEGTNTWIVGDAPSIVIDPGPDDASHLREIERAADRVGAILLTHAHPDHAPGAEPLAASTGAPIHAFRPPPGGVRLRDGDPIRVGDATVLPIHTPGHTPDHVAFWLERARGLFTGDAVLGRGTSVIDPPEGDLAAYLRSLRRMRDLDPRTLYPGHGPIVLEAGRKLDEYLSHRSERERQILDVLAGRPSSIAEVVDVVYAAYPSEVRALAMRSVLAHLKKLEGEGRVEHTGRGRSTRYFIADPRACQRCGRPVGVRSNLCDRCRLAALQEPPGA